MSTNMMRRSPAPSDLAASTYSFSLIDSVWPRTMRPTDAKLKNTITPIDDPEARPDDGDEGDTEEQEREREDHVHRAREHAVGHSAEVAGDQPDDDSEEHGEGARDDACEQRDARRVHDPHEDVAAQVVGAEQKGRAGPTWKPFRRQAGVEVLVVRPVPDDVCDQRCAHGHEDDGGDDHGAGDGDPVAAKPRPGELPRAPALDRARLVALALPVDPLGRGQGVGHGAASTSHPDARCSPGSTGKWHAVAWPGGSPVFGSSTGSSAAQRSLAFGHRPWKRQPFGGSIGDGTSPLSRIRSRGSLRRRRCP